MNATEVICLMNLEPLPGEGGYFRRTYCSTERVVLPQRSGAPTLALSSAIYYLVTPESFSALHRVPKDELFHFYAGDAVEMFEILADGQTRATILGNELEQGQVPQKLVPAHVWQGTRLRDGGAWALLGATVVPGFEWEDLEVGDRQSLIEQFPQSKAGIERFTRV